MDFELGEEHRMLKDLVARFVRDELMPLERVVLEREARGEESRLTDEQWGAVRGAFAARISVLTGGPGVGKTACTRTIVAEAERAGVSVALCAPTGRAARRLEEATGHEAQTIHRMLEWMPGREPGFKPGRPLPTDLAIVDEASMLNLRLIEVLLGGLQLHAQPLGLGVIADVRGLRIGRFVRIRGGRLEVES